MIVIDEWNKLSTLYTEIFETLSIQTIEYFEKDGSS